MIHSTTFILFGQTYRCRQFSAREGMRLFAQPNASPQALLQHTSVQVNDQEYALNTPEAMDHYVLDPLAVVSPMTVLKELMGRVEAFNFDFITTFDAITIPPQFLFEKGKTVVSKHVHSMIGALIQNHYATLRELETVYSVEDLFILYDALLEERVATLLANEVALKKQKRRSHAFSR
ncbi:hypothetical protein COMNV_00901 [Commensalibacter sp. Nvir]|uniref:hypothetical protein n=1 Tax=Commensalibacter sp. Nvir TaxID=3069817 RepID=UPI002D294F93|nr:hypothetical protein COMNV_00901 [Commensalibacter sp. Nvir]